MNQIYEKFDSTDSFDLQLINNLPFLKKIAAKYIKNEEDIKDLIQDTVYKAIKNKDKFNSNSNFKGWLVTILKNTFINQYHKSRYRKYFVDFDSVVLEGETMQEPRLNTASQIHGSCNTFPFSDRYNIVIKSLSHDYRLLILMCDIEGYSYQQIAEYLGCPVGTVRSRLYRSRKCMVKIYRKMVRSGRI